MQPTLTLTLCLTHDCPLRCRYCYAGRKYAAAMPRETARRAIDMALREAERSGQALDLGFFGGEPLMEWELLQSCDAYLRERAARLPLPPRFSLTTNGVLLTPDKLAWLRAQDYQLVLSVDGSPAMHNLNRVFPDGRGSHALLLPVLEQMREQPSAKDHLVCVVSPNNVVHLAEGVHWLAEHSSAPIGLNFDYWSSWCDADVARLREQYRLCAELMLQSYRAGKPLHLECLEGKIITHLNGGYRDCDRCRLGEQEICVSVDGNFFPCSRLVGSGDDPALCFGNVLEGIDRARQAWLIATRGNTHPACRVCSLRRRCMNGCGCTNYATTGRIDRVAPITCALEKLLIELADEVAATLYAERNPAFLRRFYG